MKERPILFSAPMVRAILDGTKTQTRRVVKPQPIGIDEDGAILWREGQWSDLELADASPYGREGDRLWVRETFGLGSENGVCSAADEQIFYRATDPAWDEDKTGFRWKPSIFMRRVYSRITLEVTGVRVERLNEISEADAIAEGIDTSLSMDVFYSRGALATSRAREDAGIPKGAPCGPRAWYAELWESINGIGSWDVNPWVWVIEFRKIQNGALSNGGEA